MNRLRVLPVLALVFFFVSTADAAITSRLEGRAVDDQDRPLAGVTVTISSDSLIGGPQTAVTAEDGGFAFHLLLVGVYTIDAELVGYTPATATARVQLDRTAVVTLRLVPVKFADEIEVTSDVPIIDPVRTNTGEVFTERYLQLTSIGSEGRDYLQIMNQAAGVVPNPPPYPQEVFGASYSANAYLVDGFNTVDSSTGASGTRFNFDAIEEASVITAGAAAEFGWGTGGILNVVTKSGGNRFSGTFDARYSDQRFIESGEHFDPDEDTFTNRILSATLGGPVLRDKLWFFVAIDNWHRKETPEGAPATEARTQNSLLGKLTWAINPSNRLMARYSTTPSTRDYFRTSRYRTPEATNLLEENQPTGQLELNSVLSDRLLLTASLGFSRESVSLLPMINDLDTPFEVDLDRGLVFSNPLEVEIADRFRDHHRAKLTWFAGEALGPHQLDAGFEYHKLRDSTSLFTPGGYGVYYYNNAYRDPPWPDGDGDGLVDFRLGRDYPAETARDSGQAEAEGWSGFVQDQWRPIPSLTVNLGLRYDTMAHTNTVGETVADFDKWLPRVGVAWDIGNRGRHVLRGSWGRYAHPGVTGLGKFVSGTVNGTEVYFGLDYLCGHPEIGICDRDTAAAVIGEEFIHVDSDGDEHPFFLFSCQDCAPRESIDTLGVGSLRVPYRDELILAYETRVAQESSLELSYVRIDSHDLIDDTCNNNTWAWGDGNPPSLDDPSTWTDETACTGPVWTNMPGAENHYEALVLRAASRARPWFHLIGSYTYSTQRANNQAQPRWGFASNAELGGPFTSFPTNFVNRDGDIDNTEHWLKINGYFYLPLEFVIGVGATYFSGSDVGVYADCWDMLNPNGSGLAELERLGIDYDEMVQYCQSEFSGEILLDTQAGPRVNVWQLDLQLSKVFRVGRVSLTPIVSIFNVTSEEAVTGYTWDPFGSLGYGTAVSWQDPRRWEVGFRVEF